MKLQFNTSELMEFKLILESCVPDSENLQHQLIEALLIEVYTKIHGKSLFPKQKTTISLTLAQSIAVLLHFAGFNNDNEYQNNLIRIIVAKIHKYISSINTLNNGNTKALISQN